MIYENVKEACKKRGVTISKLEEDLGFSRSSVCKWNENEPGVYKVKQVADYLKLKVEELLKEQTE